MFGYSVKRLPSVKRQEIEIADFICIAERLGPEESRWYIAHCLGHKAMHEGNQWWVYKNTRLGCKYGREAQDFAHALLMDDREAINEGLTCSSEVEDYFKVPEEFVGLQAPMVLDYGSPENVSW